MLFALSLRREEKGRLRDPQVQQLFESKFTAGSSAHGTLLIHGFTGSPWDMDPIHHHSVSLGKTTYSMVLPGHSQATPKALHNVEGSHYREAVQEALAFLTQSPNVIDVDVIGFSVGGDAALDCASHPSVRSVTVINPFTIVPSQWWQVLSTERWSRLLGHCLPYVKRDNGHVLCDKGRAEYEPGYLHTSIRAFLKAQEFAHEVWRNADSIPKPLCFIYSPQDIVSDPTLMASHATRLCTKPEDRIIVCENSGHVLMYDKDRDAALTAIEEFWGALNHKTP